MNEVYEFLKKCGTYYIATVDGDTPRVRPFGTIDMFDGKLYIQTGKKKEFFKQLGLNPNFELCAFDGGKWLRVTGKAVYEDNLDAQIHMLDSYPELKGMYVAGDGNTAVIALTQATATFYSFTDAPKTVKW